ncbi:MAG TPA: chemotaxis protein CheB, partial [Edaphobacter sp.]|nr:chemotaxis protein CheB [Edaphobacter sp.]
ENHQRPSINALFRSAAAVHKERVVGMVLSGYLDDGTVGLWWVKQFGGVAIVQDPRDAEVPDMPRSALDHVSVDHIIAASEAGPLLSRLVDGAYGPQRKGEGEMRSMERKQAINATCPECRGPMSEVVLGDLREYRCLVGHAFSARALLQVHSDTQEKALWSAVVALEEASNLVQAVAGDFPAAVAERLGRQVAKKREQAAEIRRILEHLEPLDTGQ